MPYIVFLIFFYFSLPAIASAEKSPLLPEKIWSEEEKLASIKYESEKNNDYFFGISTSLKFLEENQSLSPNLIIDTYIFIAECFSRLDFPDLSLFYLNRAGKDILNDLTPANPHSFPETAFKTLKGFQENYLKKKDYATALDFYHNIANKKIPSHPQLTYLAILSLFAQSNIQEMNKLISRIPPDSPYYFSSRYLYGVGLLNEGRIKESIDHFEELLSGNYTYTKIPLMMETEEVGIDSFKEKIFYLLGLLYYDVQDYKRAENYLDRLNYSQIYKRHALWQKIWCALKEKDFPRALFLGENYIEKYPESIEVESIYFTLGEISQRQKNFEKAMDYFEEGKKIILNRKTFLQDQTLNPGNINQTINYLELLRFPQIRYLPSAFPLVSIKELDNPMEKYYLNLIYTDNSRINTRLDSLIESRKFQDSILKVKIRQLSIYNKINYTIFYYQQKENEYRELSEKIDRIILNDLETRLNKSESEDILNFSLKEEIDFFREIENNRERGMRLKDYLTSLKEVFFSDTAKAQEIIPALQELLINSPLLYQEKQKNPDRENSALTAANIFRQIRKLNQDADTSIWRFTSLFSIVSPENEKNWPGEYKKIKTTLTKTLEELNKNIEEFTSLEKGLLEQIKNALPERKKYFQEELRLTSEKKLFLKEKISFRLAHLSDQIKDLIPLRNKVDEVILRNKALEDNFNLFFIRKEDDFKNLIAQETAEKIKEMEKLSIESEISQVDSLFFSLP